MNIPARNTLVAALNYPDTLSCKPGLSAALGGAKAAQLSRVIGEQVLRQSLPVANEFRATIYYAPEESHRQVERWLAWARGRTTFESHATATPADAIHWAFDHGASKVVQIGTYCLGVDRPLVERLFEGLEQDAAIVGPGDNGDCYLLALREYRPGLLDGIPWGTPDTCEAVMTRLEAAGMDFEVMEDEVIIEQPEDLARISPNLLGVMRPNVREQLRILGFEDVVARANMPNEDTLV
ncbi:MAG: DUF2064 domain-containing protein [Candidatus Sumerlaeaceae bacterium]|nr:DUF2064 domain-containing protein [Candidatus Sumerlaeaceae bacterium]